MKILFVERCLWDTDDYPSFDQITRIGRIHASHTISVVVGSFPALDMPGVTSVRCPFFPKIERIKGWLFTRAALRAFRGLGKRNFDVIHAHFAYPAGLAARELGKRYGIPYVITGQGSDVLLYPKENRYLRKSVRSVLTDAAAFIGVSEHVCCAARELGADVCSHIPDGVDPGVFHPSAEARQRGKGKRRVLFAGTFLPVKNVLCMMDAFAIVSRKNADVEFRLAGEGPLGAAMREKAEALGIQGRTVFTGMLSHGGVADEMRAADVLCLPSVSEGWGNVIAEAMACGTPAVGSNVEAIPEQIVSDEYGLLCDPSSPEDIAEKLLLALERDWDREKIAERGRTHTREGAVEKIIGVYEEVMKK
jgi:glycosyltransferase involved in cell wall biosynthesis